MEKRVSIVHDRAIIATGAPAIRLHRPGAPLVAGGGLPSLEVAFA